MVGNMTMVVAREPEGGVLPSETAQLRTWMSAQLSKQATGIPHDRLAEEFLRALLDPRIGQWARLRRAILKQEIWRLLVSFRRAGKGRKEAILGVQTLFPGLLQRLRQSGATPATLQALEQGLRGAFDDVKDWPQV